MCKIKLNKEKDMRLLKVSLENQNVYVDLIDGEYRLRLYEDGLVFDRTYKNVKKIKPESKRIRFKLQNQ